MFGEVFRFELRQQLRRAVCWLIFLVFGLLAFWEATSPAIKALGVHGEVWRNAPLILARLLAMLGVFSPLAIGTFAATAALRDRDCRTLELVLSTPVNRRARRGARFAAALVLAVFTMLACTVGMALGAAMPWIDPARLGPADWQGYLWALAMVLPGTLFVSALLFVIAERTGSFLKTYIGVVVLLVLLLISHQLAFNAGSQGLAAVIDPFGYHTLDVVTRYWTAADINHRLPPIAGAILANRLLWGGLGIVLLGGLLWPADERLSLDSARRVQPRQKAVTRQADPLTAPARGVDAKLHHGGLADWTRLRHWLAFDTAGVLRGTPFLVILLLALVLLTVNLFNARTWLGATQYPLTFLMLQTIRSSFDWLLCITVLFYAGELVWRDRELRVALARDALPWADWSALAAKFGALVAMVVVFLAVGGLWGVGWQLLHGFARIQPGLYLGTLALYAIPYVLLAALCLTVQTVCGNRYIGYLLTALWLVVSKVATPLFGWGDHMVWYGTASPILYSGLNGFGGYLKATLWFDAWWAIGALILLVVASLFWPRGSDTPWRACLRTAAVRLRGPVAATATAAVLAFIACGAWVFYNTHVLNRVADRAQIARERAHYEKAFARYRDVPQPRITHAKLDIAIHPHRRSLDVRGTYTLVNRNTVPVHQLLVYYPPGFKVESAGFAPHTIVRQDMAPHFVVYHLATPLAPGASMPFAFHLDYAAQGFSNAPQGLFIAHNGSFFDTAVNGDRTGHDVLPQIGYQPTLQVSNPRTRRRLGLPKARPALAPLGDKAALAVSGMADDADWMHFDVTLSTAADQTAVTSGVLERTWTSHGRRYFHYVTEAPVPDDIPFASGRYALERAQSDGVGIEVYYDPRQPWNAERVLRDAQASLAYDQTHFGAYPFHQLRLVEVPYNYTIGAEAFPGVLVMRETSASGFLTDLGHSGQLDSILSLLGHEVSHEWWPYQEMPANVRGVNMVTESFAQYASLMVMKQHYGADRMRALLDKNLRQYLMGRHRADAPESPLYDVGGPAQGYIFYGKGALAFYTLQDYLGEDTVDAVLRQFVADTRFKPAPYATSTDFLHLLSASVAPKWQPLIDDLFRRVTLFDDRMLAATAKPLPDGEYRVTLHVHAAKYYADGNGKETRAKALGIPIEIGVFARAKGGEGQDEMPLLLEKYPVKDGDSTITVTVRGKPYEAGIDPFDELVERVPSGTRARVAIK